MGVLGALLAPSLPRGRGRSALRRVGRSTSSSFELRAPGTWYLVLGAWCLMFLCAVRCWLMREAEAGTGAAFGKQATAGRSRCAADTFFLTPRPASLLDPHGRFLIRPPGSLALAPQRRFRPGFRKKIAPSPERGCLDSSRLPVAFGMGKPTGNQRQRAAQYPALPPPGASSPPNLHRLP